MKYYFKILLLSFGIGIFNILIYLFLLQFQIAPNGGYIPQEFVEISLIILGIPLQFIVLTVVSLIFKKNNIAILVTSCLFVVACFLINWFTSTHQRREYNDAAEERRIFRKTEELNYDTAISTPEGYPIKLLSQGYLSTIVEGKGYQVGYFLTDEVYSENWGSGPTDGSGGAVPDSLKLYWFSFLENKYYRLNTKLDKRKISDYFKKGYEYDNIGNLEKTTRANYQDLTAGIAPGGDVALWISSPNDIRIIDVFKAKEVSFENIGKDDIVKDNEIKKVLSDTCTCEEVDRLQFRRIVHNNTPIPYGIWTKKYLEKFNWKIAVSNLEPIKYEMYFHFYNGERFSLYNEKISALKHQKQVVPEHIAFTFFENKKTYKAYFEFDEDEIFNNFKKLTKENPSEPIDIILNFNSDFTKSTIKLKSKYKTLDFVKMKSLEVSEN